MKTKKSDRQREMKDEIIRNLLKSWLYSLPGIFGFILIIIGVSPILGAFIAGFTGVIIAVRKEMPSGRGTVRGTIAVVVGVLFTSIFWGAAIGLLLIEVLE